MSDAFQPAHKLAVHALGPDQLAVHRPGRRVDQHRLPLPAAQPAVAAHELFEGGDLVRPGIETTVDDKITYVVAAVVAEQVGGCLRPEGGQRISAGDLPAAQAVHSVAAEHDGAIRGRPGADEADARMAREPGQQPGVGGLDLLGRQAAGMAREVDEREVPGGRDDQFGGFGPAAAPACGGSRPGRLRASSSTTAASLERDSMPTTPCCCLTSARKRLTGVRASSVPVAAMLSVVGLPAPAMRSRTTSSSGVPYRCRKVAPWLCPWSLKDDELVGPRTRARPGLERREHRVHALQRPKRLGARGPGVVGDLVVVGEVT